MREVEERKRRRAILTYLNDAPRNESSAALAVEACRALGIPTYLDQAITTIRWLHDQGLVIMREENDFVIAKLTKSGAEIARDERTDSRIERPFG